MKMTHRRAGVLVPVLALVLAASAAAQDKVLTPDLILTVRQVTDAQLSPDGSRVVLQISRPRSTDERGAAVPELWIVPAAGGEPVRFTTNEEGDRAPQWSPDGSSIAFLSRRPGSEFTQVHVIPAAGGEARRLTTAENNVGSFKWSRDGSRIAYTVTDPKTKEELENERRGKDWIVADQNYKHIRLHAIDVASGKTHVVTETDITVHDFDWAPDSTQLLVMSAPTPTVDDSFMRLSIQTVPASGGPPTLVTKTEGKLSHPRWSPDGKWIAWLGAVQLNDPFAGSVFVAPAGGGQAQNLTPDWEGTGTWLGWLPGAVSTIAFVATERQDTKVYTLAVADRTRQAIDTGTVSLLGGVSFASDGRRLAYAASTPAHPNEAFVTLLGSPGATRLTTLNPQLQGIQLGEQEVVRWKARDGWDIEGILVKPVGFRQGQRYPVIMQPHGGPESADLDSWYGTSSRWGQMLAGRGYAVFYPNYRGSIGRGPKFAMADHRDLMGREFEDMLDGLDHLVKLGIADSKRIGVGGGSYGGYTSAWAATYGSERFRAAIMWMGISNWISMTGTSDIFYENSTVHWDAIMYEASNYEMYWERSPLKHIMNANTPTLIIHGAVDPRVPIGQSEEMYTALKWKGVPVEFVRYPRAGHGVTERAHQEDFMHRVIGWFDKHVKPGGITDQ
ncbi:MAG: S9 family peptidase [Acidobacteria bacterium]|nr:S9 family peptidase [Acidobacteriota bacterium]